MKPPIAPIGLEYIAEALRGEGYDIEILDLCWVDDWKSAVTEFFINKQFGAVGVTLRNTDDCAFTTKQSFLGDFINIVNKIRSLTDAMIVVGGVGFSTMPELILTQCSADAGIWGDGEFAFVELAKCLAADKEIRDIPNVIRKRDERWHRNPPQFYPLKNLPGMSRNLVDNQRYLCEGGQVGFETKRGCSCNCIYCADPVAKGNEIRCRPPEAVVVEIKNLLAQGIDCLHTCDCEFNLPSWHAEEICIEMIKNKLGGKIGWYAYCTPLSFSPKLAGLMREAGCIGINFGVDNGDDEMLKRLKRGFSSENIENTARACKEAGIVTMFDLLLGSPGESKESITHTIELIKKTNPDRVGVSIGVRVYPHTELAGRIERGELKGGLVGNDGKLETLFYLEPNVSPFITELLEDLIDNDPRFLFFNPQDPDKNYNYNANQVLVDAIKKGYRGAYWDILRRIKENC